MQALQTAPSRWILPAHSTESHLWAALSTTAPSTSSYPPATANWRPSLSCFPSKSGITPSGSLLFDSAGNLYGITNAGGSGNNDGVVYELTPAKATWTQTILYIFSKQSGSNPVGGLT